MSIEVFNRYEKKFIITNQQYLALLNRLEGKMTLDPFNQDNGFYTICNIYYDTPEDLLIQKSLSKPVFKEKLRLRSYGVPQSNTQGFLEIKKKYEGKVNKRRTQMTLNEAYDFIETKEAPELKDYHHPLVMKEIEFFLSRYALQPSVYIAYDRTAYFCDELRITFDTNIRTRRYDLKLELGDYGDQLLDKDTWLMEVKAPGAIPLWFVKLLSELKMHPTSFSKYGSEYTKTTQRHYDQKVKGDMLSCLNTYLLTQTTPLR